MPTLDPVEARVVGVLVEKQMTTADNYPLTLSGVVAGCNQSTNRDPVMTLEEDQVERALVRLHDRGVATPVRRAGDRSTKYRHKLGESLEIDEPSQAILAVLLLRGPQTSGELRTRTERYVSFDSVQEVDTVIDRLAEMHLVERLPRSPGQSQRRIRHLLESDDTEEIQVAANEQPRDDLEGRLSSLEDRFAELLDRLGVDDI